MLRKKEEQLNFAINYMKKNLKDKESSLILLEYSDNYEWIKQNIEVELRDVFYSSILITQPLSLTAGAHMGPGTWGIAFLPLSLPEKELLTEMYLPPLSRQNLRVYLVHSCLIVLERE